MKAFIIFLLGYLEFFNAEAMSRSYFDDIYSGNPGAARTATYIYLCTKTNHVSESEGCVVRTVRNFGGPDGCCESCSTRKSGLYLAAITVDESVQRFTEHEPGKLIWSGAFNFYQKERCSFKKMGLLFF